MKSPKTADRYFLKVSMPTDLHKKLKARVASYRPESEMTLSRLVREWIRLQLKEKQ